MAIEKFLKSISYNRIKTENVKNRWDFDDES
jgi:hypothetical protein